MRTIRNALGLAAALAIVSSGSALAQGKGHGKGHKGDDGRGVVVVESNGNVGRVPPGLAKKPGGMPPGQYKKLYTTSQGASVLRDILIQRGYTVVRTSPYGDLQYVYYRDANGTLRRAIVRPGAERLGFVNVPQALLAEVISRLY